tara:strand:- start:164 stop:769 length:606 start_codon:yes stop_codon:yes gene_type:complete
MLIHQLFPEPLYFSKLERVLTNKELKSIDAYKAKTYKNIGNITSNDTYVLENKLLKNLKKDLQKTVMDYFDKIICTNNITPYIAQSWLNYTESNGFHHRHSHPNSLVSGVFYISADKEVDAIKFYKTDSSQLRLNTTKYNIFNSSSCKFPVETGDLFLFRSTLEHGVDHKKGTNTRISLSFNVFFKGKIGIIRELTELVLE